MLHNKKQGLETKWGLAKSIDTVLKLVFFYTTLRDCHERERKREGGGQKERREREEEPLEEVLFDVTSLKWISV